MIIAHRRLSFYDHFEALSVTGSHSPASAGASESFSKLGRVRTVQRRVLCDRLVTFNKGVRVMRLHRKAGGEEQVVTRFTAGVCVCGSLKSTERKLGGEHMSCTCGSYVCARTHATASVLMLPQSEAKSGHSTKATALPCKHTHTHTTAHCDLVFPRKQFTVLSVSLMQTQTKASVLCSANPTV